MRSATSIMEHQQLYTQQHCLSLNGELLADLAIVPRFVQDKLGEDPAALHDQLNAHPMPCGKTPHAAVTVAKRATLPITAALQTRMASEHEQSTSYWPEATPCGVKTSKLRNAEFDFDLRQGAPCLLT